MSEPKSFASLMPTLLARKGGAKPAMRHQMQLPGSHSREATARQIEDDLGFNDFHGDPDDTGHEAEIVQLIPNSAPANSGAKPGDVPEVVRQRASASARIAGPAKRRSALAEGRNAAFTLRLDAERHFKLRLACTLEGRSAQQFVTDALDRMISKLPTVEAIAAQATKPRKNS